MAVTCGVDANAIDFEISQSATELLERARHAGIPHNNIVAADLAGHIGWTIGGQIPVRAPLLALTGTEKGAFGEFARFCQSHASFQEEFDNLLNDNRRAVA